MYIGYKVGGIFSVYEKFTYTIPTLDHQHVWSALSPLFHPYLQQQIKSASKHAHITPPTCHTYWSHHPTIVMTKKEGEEKNQM